MAISEILPFATGPGANVQSQAAYEIEPLRTTGNVPGIARSVVNNKALLQSTLLASSLALFIANNQVDDVTDVLTEVEISDMLETAVNALIAAQMGVDYLNTTRIDVASAGSVNLAALAPNTRHIRITGNVAINDFVIPVGQLYFVTFSGSPTLTNGGPIVTNSGASILVAPGDTCLIRSTGANVIEILCYTRASLGGVLHVRDQKAAGTNGGTFTSGAWRTRDLNTTLVNTIPGASLTGNRVTLPAGRYEVWGTAPATGETSSHQARLYNITGATTLLNGTNGFNGGAGVSSVSHLISSFSIPVASEIEVQHVTQVTVATVGFGVGNTIGGLKAFEVFTDIMFKKVA